MIRHLLAILLLASTAHAADRYVNTDCANNGDGLSDSCAASAGSTGAYRTWDQAFSDIVSDYSGSLTEPLTVHLSGATADTNCPQITGLATTATNYLRLVVDEADRHPGTWSTSHYRLVCNSYNAPIHVSECFVRIDGLQIEQTRTGAGAGTLGNGVHIESSATNCDWRIDNNLLRYTGDYTNQHARGINTGVASGAGSTIYVRNNLLVDWKQGMIIHSRDSGMYSILYNGSHGSTDNSFDYRLYGTGATVNLYKNWCQSATGSCYNDDGSSGATFNSAANISEDTTSPNTAYRSLAIVFTDEAGDDFSLDATDTAALDDSTSTTSVTGNLTTDMLEVTRDANPDIGPLEYVSGAAAVNVLPILTEIWGY